jgi:hypothetical protein
MCGNTLVAETYSPDGGQKAVTFRRDCGATTGYSTQVSLLPATKQLPGESGNLFIADTDRGQAPSAPGGGPVVHLQWLADDHLLLLHHPAVRVFRAELSHSGVQIEYRTEYSPE